MVAGIGVAALAATPSALAAGQVAPARQGGQRLRIVTLPVNGHLLLDGPKMTGEAFMKENPGVEVVVETLPGEDFSAKMAAWLAADTMPDIIFNHSGWIEIFANDGITYPLNKLFDSELNQEHFFPSMVAVGTTADGKEQHLLAMSADAHTLYYNKEMFKEAGLEHPPYDWKWDTFYEYARKLVKKASDGSVERYAFGTAHTWISWVVCPTYSAGGTWLQTNPDGSQEFPCTTPEFIRGLKFAWDGVKDGLFMPRETIQALGGDHGYHQAFVQGKIAIADGAVWSVGAIKDAPFDWDALLVPRDVRYGLGSGTWGFSIASKSKNVELAWKYLKFLYNRDYGNYVKTGSIVPSVKAWADSPEWKNIQPPPYDRNVFIECIKYAYLRPRGVAYEDAGFVDKKLQDAYQRYALQGVPMEEAAGIMKQEFDEFLKEHPAVEVPWEPGREIA